MHRYLVLLISILCMTSCSLLPPDNQDIQEKVQKIEDYEGQTAEALFAGGCFWCVEADMEKLDGVITVISGFAGGEAENPAYDAVASGQTKHIESVLVTYDPTVVSYKKLVQHLLSHIDPTDPGGSFYDRGHQYTSAIFYQTEAEKTIAEQVIAELEDSGRFEKPIVTAVRRATAFYPAEDYHQDYYKNNPIRYNYYRHGSGRDQYLEEIWSN